MKIVIMGNGKVGQKLSGQLAQEGHDVVVIDQKAEALTDLVNNVDVMCIEGSAVDYQVQMQAGVPEADLVIACTDGDEVNMLSCLLAKNHGAARTIARVRNPEYYDQLPYISDELGLSMAINPEMSAADAISRVLLFPAANSVEPFAKGNVELIELFVDENNPLVGMSLIDIGRKYRSKTLICAIVRGQDVIIPRGQDVLKAGDSIFLASSHRDIQSFCQEIDVFRTSVKTVMIVGGGRISYYLAKRLTAEGMRVKIIESNEERCRRLAELLPGAIIACGDGTSEEVLGEEGLPQADAFVAMTGMDEVNVILSLYAKRKNVKKIVTKITQISFVDMLTEMGIETVISPQLVTANMILSYVRALSASSDSSTVESLSKLVDGKIEALEFIVNEGAPYLGVQIKDLRPKPGYLVACIVRGQDVIIPGGLDTLEAGDRVVIFTTRQHMQQLDSMFED